MKREIARASRPHALGDEPQWYKDAIIYELRVRSFYDSNGDGIGDFPGLTEKLDYLHDLGVSAIWLLPFYPSPLRDDGYDIADYADVHPECGTLADFQQFLDEAHKRGIRVITELVINHTSDQHPWFQRARRAPPGSVERDFYVWSDTADKYRDARIIFKDFEPSNWSWDPIARQYFWHRFFAHQPDLNFDNPAVHDAVFKVVDFWLEMGVDGLRLDAVPYLYEREGTNCENLEETHAFLRRLRQHVDSRFKNRMLLAEANQWPEDAAAYFGGGDECHMNFHFPIMPRMFMSIHMEDRFPIVDILAQTPTLDESCQWAMFLRNHDELTLEMVTDDERDYMYRAYAQESTMRINLGIRRRLAPLVQNDRRKMELLNGLLFSLPGAPVIYYGDEIGMGDNVFLGDRNGVRTPMQWSADRNAGFSRANPQRLILPVVIDPEYHFEAINVEAQQNSPSSLLWWMKRIVALRKRHKAFGRGSIEFLSPENPRVLAFTRTFGDETILVVANLSRFVQPVLLDLSKHKGKRIVEMFGRTDLPPLGDAPYSLTLGGHAFYWLELATPRAAEEDVRASRFEPPTIRASTLRALLYGEDRALLEEALPSFIESRRWHVGAGRAMRRATVVESIPIGGGEREISVALVSVDYAEGDSDAYMIAIGFAPNARTFDGRELPPHSGIAYVKLAAGPDARELPHGVLFDALDDPASTSPLLDAVLLGARANGKTGAIIGDAYGERTHDAAEARHELRQLRSDDTSAVFQHGGYVLKAFRRLDAGRSPELEIGRFLRGRTNVAPPAAGALQYRRARQDPTTLAVVEPFVANEGSAWMYVLDELGRFYERTLTSRAEAAPTLDASIVRLALRNDPPAALAERMGAFPDSAALLGRRVGELHLALASDATDPLFAPEPYTPHDRRSKYQGLRNVTARVLRQLRARLSLLPADAVRAARLLLDEEGIIAKRFEPLLKQHFRGVRIRVHGDLHLGQVLYTGRDFVVIDFEGDRRRPLSERVRKRHALRDVAWMLRSLNFAAFTAISQERGIRVEDRAFAMPWATAWQAWAGASFFRGYIETTGSAFFMPHETSSLTTMLDAFLFERALYELEAEMYGENAWVALHGLIALLGLESRLEVDQRGRG